MMAVIENPYSANPTHSHHLLHQHHQTSPFLTTTTPSLPFLQTVTMTTIISPSTTASSRKPSIPGQPWSHLETIALIDAYESKWYSLKRGQLKTHQWDEVAVAARCNSPQPFTKSATQCRHKIEKLRKRFRAEKNRPVPSLWPYFNRIDRMERGPLPVPVPISVKAPSNDCQERDDDEDRVGVLVEVSKEVRRFGEGMVRVEKRRMEMMWEVERYWMEMEAKRAEMIVEAQRNMLEIVDAAFAAMRKKKKARRGARRVGS